MTPPRPLSSLPRAERDRRLAAIAQAIAHVLRPDQRAALAARQAVTAIGV